MTLRYLAFLAVALLVLLVSVGVHAALRHRRGHPLLTRRYAWHLPHSLVGGVLLAQPALLLVVALFIARQGGALMPRAGSAAPLFLAGSAAPFGSVLQWDVTPGYQAQYNACVSFAVTTALRLEYREMGRALPYARFSPWYEYAFAAGGTDGDTSVQDNMDAVMAHGLVSLGHWPAFGWPPASVQDEALREGASWRQLDGSIQQVERAVDLGYAPILLLAVNDSMYNAFGVGQTDDSGAFHFYHGVDVVSYRGDGSLLVDNWWSSSYGDRGDGRIWLTPAAWSQVVASYVVAPGAATAWPDLHAIPRPTPAPPATATAKPTKIIPTPIPTATPRPRPTATPRPHPPAHHRGYLRVVVSQYLRPRPATVPSSRVLLPRGAVVKQWGAQSGHGWRHVTWHGVSGYLLARNTRAL